MDSSSKGNAPIVVAVDGSPGSAPAAGWAAGEAALRHAPLHLISGYGTVDVYAGRGTVPPQEWIEARRRGAESFLRDAAEVASRIAPDIDVSTEAMNCDPVEWLRELSSRARMIVMGEPAGALAGFFEGATVVPVSATAHCPVVVVRGDEHPDGPVVVGIDGSPTSEAAIAQAFEEASFRKAPLVALHTWSDGELGGPFSEVRAVFEWQPLEAKEHRVLAERLAGWRERYPDVEVQKIVAKDKPRHRLLDLSERAQLVVVGSRGRGGFKGMLFGSTSQALVHHAACPVMVVRRPRKAGK